MLSEFLLVSFLLVGLLVASISFWNSGNTNLSESILKRDLEKTAISLSDQLVKSPGHPEDWEEDLSKAASVGLVGHDRKLKQPKIDQLVAMNYDQLKELLGIPGYQLRVRISSLEDSVKFESGLSPTNPEAVTNSRRAAVLGKEIVFVDVMLWR